MLFHLRGLKGSRVELSATVLCAAFLLDGTDSAEKLDFCNTWDLCTGSVRNGVCKGAGRGEGGSCRDSLLSRVSIRGYGKTANGCCTLLYGTLQWACLLLRLWFDIVGLYGVVALQMFLRHRESGDGIAYDLKKMSCFISRCGTLSCEECVFMLYYLFVAHFSILVGFCYVALVLHGLCLRGFPLGGEVRLSRWIYLAPSERLGGGGVGRDI